ncbi:hypothetical protein BDV95DRAFT_284515 [Massariosphaeria phaeospora]|uniref:Uncharacterized protein n=1 Tax=Massariosphaeria phaeospora TaxID=100035 RepID=A0A7C8MGA4_9PLEO|nr:hypothetical protein BDV95DRAFT_284515 [Massariosphaeria phaeospora]
MQSPESRRRARPGGQVRGRRQLATNRRPADANVAVAHRTRTPEHTNSAHYPSARLQASHCEFTSRASSCPGDPQAQVTTIESAVRSPPGIVIRPAGLSLSARFQRRIPRAQPPRKGPQLASRFSQGAAHSLLKPSVLAAHRCACCPVRSFLCCTRAL